MTNEIGVIHKLTEEGPFFKRVLDFGISTCQLKSWDQSIWTEDRARLVRQEIEETGIHVTSFWAGWPGPRVWDFVSGPQTLGIVPAEYRSRRVDALKRAGDFVKQIGLPAIITHLGFIPENATDPLFAETVDAVGNIAAHLAGLDMDFWFETGQETPVTMLRLIQAVGGSNLGLNLDAGNLILYGRGSPVDSLDVFGSFVRNIHAKDGYYPTDPMILGKEAKVGSGKVNYPLFVKRLGEIGFTGEFIIEREITGDRQTRDIRETIEYLKRLLLDTPA